MTAKSKTHSTKLVTKCECGLPLYLRSLPFGYRYIHKAPHRAIHDRIMEIKQRNSDATGNKG